MTTPEDGAVDDLGEDDPVDVETMFEIDVVCADGHWHPNNRSQPFVVAVLAQNEAGTAVPRWRIKTELQAGVRRETYTSPFTQQERQMDVATPVSASRTLSSDNEQGVRLVCPRHPYMVPLKWRRLEPILDALIANGVQTISLQALAARVRR